jgi:hypothetical protein
MLKKNDMLQIGNTIVSLDIIEKQFVCDLNKCKGACCIHGDSGAPLETNEVEILNNIFEQISPFLRSEGVESIKKQGTSVIDIDGDMVTPLIDGKECSYTLFENGIAICGIEKAFNAGVIKFKKPISCHLYPVRITEYPEFSAVNYHIWEICKHAVKKGTNENISVFSFLKEPLLRKFGKDWYDQLVIADKTLKNNL